MSPDVTQPRTDTSTAARHRHDARNTLTSLRLQTQLLLRVARGQEDPVWQRMVAGLIAMDNNITLLITQLEHPDEDER